MLQKRSLFSLTHRNNTWKWHKGNVSTCKDTVSLKQIAWGGWKISIRNTAQRKVFKQTNIGWRITGRKGWERGMPDKFEVLTSSTVISLTKAPEFQIFILPPGWNHSPTYLPTFGWSGKSGVFFLQTTGATTWLPITICLFSPRR